MASDPAPSPVPRRLEDIDLYCLNCGYNLRGLSGDPRRCPECGQLNRIGALIPTPEMISEQLRCMESAPTFCVGLAIGIVFVVFPLLYSFLVNQRGNVMLEQLYCPAVGLVLGVLFWLTYAFRFRRSCAGRSGWVRLLGQYHICGLGASAFVVGGYWVGPKLLRKVFSPAMLSPRGSTMEVYALAWTCVVLALVCWLGPRFHARVRKRMHELQRDVAASQAREVARKLAYLTQRGFRTEQEP